MTVVQAKADSNGWLVINGGTITAQACSSSVDAGIDSDNGIYINGGKVVASGNMLDHIAGGNQTYVVFRFANRQKGDKTYTLKNSAGKRIGEYTPANAFTYLIVAGSELIPDDYTFWQGKTQLSGSKTQNFEGVMPQGDRPHMPNGEQGDPPKKPGDMTPPDNKGGMIGGNMMPSGETSTTFAIAKGGNQFSNVAQAR